MKLASQDEFEKVRMTNTIVNQVLYQGGDSEDCVVIMADHIESLRKELLELRSIAPRKFRLNDGRVMIWHCPDDLVPFR